MAGLPRILSAWALVLVLGLTAGVGGCGLTAGPRTIEMPLSQLEQLLGRQFPLRTGLGGLVELTASTPRLSLRPETNRLALEIDLATDERPPLGARRGTLAVEAGLRYEPSDHTLRLVQASVERLTIEGLPEALQAQLTRLGRRLAAQWLDDRVVYTLRERDVERLASAALVPGAIRVTDRGVSLDLVAAP